MKKVALDVIKPWIAQKVTELLGAEDDIVVTFAYAMLENEQVTRRLRLRRSPAPAVP